MIPTSMTNQNDDNESLVEAIYGLALNPDSLESFSEVWAQFIEEHDLVGTPESELFHSMEKHFDRAFKILERIGRVGASDTRVLEQFVEGRSTPCFAMTTKGKIIAINEEAKNLLGANDGVVYAQDLVHTDSAKTVKKNLLKVVNTESPLPTLILLRNRLPALMLMQKMVDSGIIVADIAGSSWNDQVNATLKAMYSLTTSECLIASSLYQGLSVKEIAEAQNRSLETIRKHTKSILSKTQTHSQPKLMRLLTSLNFSYSNHQSPPWLNKQCDNHSVKLKDGRQLAYYDTGQKRRKTIVVIHGVLHDPELPPSVHQFLLDQGYRIVGVSRAWFGASSPATSTNDILGSASSDMKQLLDSLDIKKVTLIGNMAGSIHALTFASLYPKQVERIIGLAGMVPIVSDRQIEAMPRTLRAVAKTARYFPRMFPTIIRTGVAIVDSGNIRKILNIGYRNSPIDLEATKSRAIYERIARGYKFALQNGYAAYTFEVIAVMQDKRNIVKKVHCPIDLVHGEQDGLTSSESVQEFCKDMPNAQLHNVPEGGHLLLYTSPEKVIDKLKFILN